MKREKYSLFDSLNMFLLCLIIPFIVSMFVVLILMAIMGEEGFTSSFIYVLLSLTLNQVVFLVIYFVHKQKTKTSFKALGLKKINKKQILVVVLIGLICILCLTPLANVFEGLLTKWGKGGESLPLSLDNFWNFLLMFVTLGILAPISEEIIFRGVIFNGLKEKGGKFAVLISGLFFMLMHLSINQCAYQLIMGFVLGLLVLYTNSIISSFIVHFINNAGVLLINYIIPSVNEVNCLSTTYIIIAIILFISALFALYFSFKWLKKLQTQGKGNLQTQENLQTENAEESVENVEIENNSAWRKPEKVYYTTTLVIGVAVWFLSALLTFLS